MIVDVLSSVCIIRRCLAGAEHGTRVSQRFLNPHCGRVRTAKHAPRGRFNLLERRHALADIVECGAVGPAECVRVIPPHPERGFMTLAENASRHGYRSAQQCLGFSAAL